MQRFDIKDPAESVQLTFNMQPGLAATETLAGSPTVNINVIEGTDANPSLLLNGVPGFDSTSTQVIQPVTGGTNGCEYQFVVTCGTTNVKKVLTLVAALPVRR